MYIGIRQILINRFYHYGYTERNIMELILGTRCVISILLVIQIDIRPMEILSMKKTNLGLVLVKLILMMKIWTGYV